MRYKENIIILYNIIMSDTINLTDVICNKRTRGRPRKNIEVKKTVVKQINNEPIEDDIILHFPITTKDMDSKLTMSSISDTTSDIDEVMDNMSLSEQNIDGKQKQLLRLLNEKDNEINELKKYISKLGKQVPDNIDNDTMIVHQLNNFDKTDTKEILHKKTNCACFWDTYEINAIPYFLPERYNNGKFEVIGCFCSLNCAVAYNLQMDDYKVNERYSLLKWMYNRQDEIIFPSPSITSLKKFGGTLTIEEYRNKLQFGNIEFRVVTQPMICIQQTLEERIIKPKKYKQ